MTSIDRQQAFSGTKEVAAALALDAARLEAYLAQNVAGFAGPLTVRQFKGGQSNPTYLLEPRRDATCCAASRRENCCPRRTRSTANSA